MLAFSIQYGGIATVKWKTLWYKLLHSNVE